jgi:DNA cross-link repair 1A protein
MFLFKIPNGKNSSKYILHTGDFRASHDLVDRLKAMNIQLDIVYLDTTYCDSNYSFLPQEKIVSLGVETVFNELKQQRKLKRNVLIVCGSYTIGKERVFIAIAKSLGVKVCVAREKYNTLKCLNDSDLDEMLTLNPNETNLHVLPMGKLNYKDLPEYLAKFSDYDFIIAIKPTGWTHKAKGDQKGFSVESKSKSFIIYGSNLSAQSTLHHQHF